MGQIVDALRSRDDRNAHRSQAHGQADENRPFAKAFGEVVIISSKEQQASELRVHHAREANRRALAHDPDRHEVGRRLYNDYGYGGFLLWWMPEEKIFIDGRMPAWRIGDRTIFYDYVTISSGARAARDLLLKYRVDWALIQRDSQLAAMLNGDPAWRQIYEDAKVVIMRRTL